MRKRLRVRAKSSGTPSRPRLCVRKSLKNIFVQLIDDSSGKILAATDYRKLEEKNISRTQLSEKLGEDIAQKAKVLGIDSVFFDRGHYTYHGHIQAVAEGARKAGLKF